MAGLDAHQTAKTEDELVKQMSISKNTMLELLGLTGLLLVISGCAVVEIPSLEIQITNLFVTKQLCDLELNSSYEITLTWHAQGGTLPLVVWISYRLGDDSKSFGPFPWPEQQSFTLLLRYGYEVGPVQIIALVEDKEGTKEKHKRWLPLKACASLPPMKPIISIIPSSGTATQSNVTAQATMTNTLEASLVAQTILATGCAVERTQPELPLLLGPFESKTILVILRCPAEGATWKLAVAASLP